jgi:hypothetical protein
MQRMDVCIGREREGERERERERRDGRREGGREGKWTVDSGQVDLPNQINFNFTFAFRFNIINESGSQIMDHGSR